MKKYFIIAVAALVAMCACTKNEVASLPDQEISFQVASYLNQTKAEDQITGQQFPTTATFGTYAWQNPRPNGENDPQFFMENQEIGYNQSVWKATDRIYYWPKTGAVDFISYAPFSKTAPWLNVSTESLTASVTGLAADADYLYADKAVGYSANVDLIEDDVKSGFTGVPTLFHHALAQVAAKVYAAKLYDGTDLASSDVRWEINVDEASLNKVADGGSLLLKLKSTPTTGMVPWYGESTEVWKTDTYRKSYTFATPAVTATTEAAAQTLLDYTSVIPQTFVAETGSSTDTPDGQYIHIKITVKSYNKLDATDSAISNLYSTETFEKNVPLTTMVGEAANVSWKMNYRYLYYICINPSGLVELTFDPAITSWAEVTGSTTWAI